MSKKFVHLHLHTEYSMLDGAVRHDKLFARCKELGMPAVAMTDHGNMYGAVSFAKAAVALINKDLDPFEFVKKGMDYDVKPIFGCEFYVAQDMHEKSSMGGKPKFNHLVLLAKNRNGYKNLIQLSSKAFVDGFYYKPRIDYKLLEEYSKDLVCLSACLQGSIPQALLEHDNQRAQHFCQYFKDMFGSDFYIELQDHHYDEQRYVLSKLIDLGKKNGVGLVATNDVHYLHKKDSEMQRVLQNIAFGTFDGERNEDYFATDEFYLKSYDEMYELFGHIEGALENTIDIAEKCNCEVLVKEKLYPIYQTNEGSADEVLKKRVFEGLQKKYKVFSKADKTLEDAQLIKTIEARAQNELNIIIKSEYSDYFLVVADFIHEAERKGIPVGPGRGSGVGSIAAYGLGITKVDPLKYDLIFERFLNLERVSAPDFDIDFCVDRRDEVIDYVIEKYGKDKVAQIITFASLAPKNAIKDVGRVYRYPFSEVNKITKAMPGLIKHPISMLVGLEKDKEGVSHILPDLAQLYQGDTQIRKILDMAMQIEGLKRQPGTHAAGVVICKDNICEHVPLSRSGEDITTQFYMIEVEELGLLKMDFLGLRTLTDIKKACDMVQKNKGITIDFYAMEYDDPEIFKMIGEGDTTAVFQLESTGMRRFMVNLKPESLEDIIAGISLYRPGPMDSIDEYCDNKRNPARIKYVDKRLEPILGVTYGIIVYQEQVMRIVQDMGGFSLGQADEIRRVMSKKKADKMAKEKVRFIKGCKNNGISEEVATAVFDKMESFASYAFNKSHAAAYAYVAYQTAYLKRYHFLEFMAAVLNNRLNKFSELVKNLNYLKEKNVPVLVPDINKSDAFYSVEGNGIRIGLAAIKNVGIGIIEAIICERQAHGDFASLWDFLSRMDGVVNRRLVESFIYAGAFDSFGYNRAQCMGVYAQMMDVAQSNRAAKNSGQLSFFDVIADEQPVKFPRLQEFDDREKFGHEKNVLGVYVSGNPLDKYKKQLMQYNVDSRSFSGEEDIEEEVPEFESATITDNMRVSLGGMLDGISRMITKKGKHLATARLEDLYGFVNLMISGDKADSYGADFADGKMVTVKGRVSAREGEAPIVWVDTVSAWQTVERKINETRLAIRYSYLQEGDIFFDSLCKILDAYSGDSEVVIVDLDTGEKRRYNKLVEICTPLINELVGLLGADNVKTF